MTTATVSLPLPDARALHPGPGVYPAVPAVPGGAAGLARAAVARALLSRAAARLPIWIQAPDGRLSGVGVPGPGDPRPGRLLPAPRLGHRRVRGGLHDRSLGLR